MSPTKTITALAPSNIALIKYMGKKDSEKNIPENPSVSMTLKSLCSVVELTQEKSSEAGQGLEWSWVPEFPRTRPEDLGIALPGRVPALTDAGVQRVYRHLERVFRHGPEILSAFGLKKAPLTGKLTLRTFNTFPPSSGIASSASSYAALTLAGIAALSEDQERLEQAWSKEPSLRLALAQLARRGSGSACRSMEGPWVLWEGETVSSLKADKMPPLAHFVILIDSLPKLISSSEAHTRVRTSPLWAGRVERVEGRKIRLTEALKAGNMAEIARIAWIEAWEMHSLFHTAVEPFSYWRPLTIEGLHWLAPLFREMDPPIVTLDAGPNLHLTVDQKFRSKWRELLRDKFPDCDILEDEPGNGARWIHEMG